MKQTIHDSKIFGYISFAPDSEEGRSTMFYLLCVVALSIVAYYVKYLYSYWARRGFPYLNPTIPTGCLGPVLRQKESMGSMVRDIHLRSKERVLGLYFFFRPTLLIRDPQLIKRVLFADFDHFTDRGLHYDEVNDPVGAHLFAMPGKRWKEMRAKFSPTFTSAKLKNMFLTIGEKADSLKHHLLQLTDADNEVQMKTLLVRLNINIISSIFFGFELNTFEDPNHPFAKIGDMFMDPNILRNNVIMFLLFMCPSIMTRFKIPFLSPDVTQYVLKTFNSVIEARKKDPSLVRNDFIKTVMDMMENEKDAGDEPLKMELYAAQAFIFYIGGYETSASTTSFVLYELAQNPVWMKRARDEVDALMKKRNGRPQYEDMAELKVLDMCINEALRKYPVIPFLNRECTKEYTIPETDLVVPKGTPVILPVYGLNMDEENFPDPQRFDPNRFAEDTGEDRPFYPVRIGMWDPRGWIDS